MPVVNMWWLQTAKPRKPMEAREDDDRVAEEGLAGEGREDFRDDSPSAGRMRM
jgi:hypothetical protein